VRRISELITGLPVRRSRRRPAQLVREGSRWGLCSSNHLRRRRGLAERPPLRATRLGALVGRRLASLGAEDCGGGAGGSEEEDTSGKSRKVGHDSTHCDPLKCR